MTDHLKEEDFQERFSMSDFVTSCRQAFEEVGRGQILNPPREEVVETRDGASYFRLDMPAEWPGRYRARKIIEEVSDVAQGRLDKREAYISLEDLRTGVQLRLDAGFITDMRTGAAGALGIEYLHAGEVKRVGILGTGRIARCLALACDTVFDLHQIRCTSRSAHNRAAFAEAVGPRLAGADLHMAASLGECLEGVDAVLTAVPTPEPILADSDIDHVDTVTVIAGDSRTCQVQAEVLQRRRVVVDVLEQAQRSGEFRWAHEQGCAERIALARSEGGDLLSIADAACGRVPAGRGVAYLTGMGAQDLCAVAMIYEGM